MAIIVRYQIEGYTNTYPTINQALIVEALGKCEGVYLEQYRLEQLAATLDMYLEVKPRTEVFEVKEKPNETV